MYVPSILIVCLGRPATAGFIQNHLLSFCACQTVAGFFWHIVSVVCSLNLKKFAIELDGELDHSTVNGLFKKTASLELLSAFSVTLMRLFY